MQILELDDQLCWFGLDSSYGKTSQELSPRESLPAKTSASSRRRSSESSAINYQFLDLTPGAGNLLGESYWETLSPYVGGSSTLNTGASPKDAVESSLSQILEDSPPSRYYLSRTACLGILRRASERGKELPPQLKTALMMQAGLIPPQRIADDPIAFAANQRDEVRDLHDVAGALGAQPGMKQQTFVSTAFSAGAGASAGSIGYTEEGSPTLKGSEGGNMVPAILCLTDQGGERMGASEDVSGALRAQEHGHQPLVLFENHGIDARYTGPHPVAPTMSARYGTGGNNVPLVGQEVEAYCITGNAIDRQPQNGGNGIRYRKDIAYTLTATDHHAVFSRQRVDRFQEDNVVSTESARQKKDATDLVLQQSVGALTSSDHRGPSRQYVTQDKCIVESLHLIRRLTPLECERLQGFPDRWTDIPGASDSARYKALGNSVAIPCVEYVMRGIAAALAKPIPTLDERG